MKREPVKPTPPAVTEVDHRQKCRRCPNIGTDLVLWRGEALCEGCFTRAVEADKFIGGGR